MFQDIIVSEDDILKDAIQKAKGLIGIEQASGEVVLRIPKAQVGVRELIALHLIGRYFANKMETAESASLSTKDIALSTGIEYGTVASRLAELVNGGWIKRVTRGQFEVYSPVLNSFLDEIVASLSKRTTVSSEPNRPNGSIPTGNAHPTRRRNDGSLTSAILDALGTEWGGVARNWNEIKQELRRNGVTFSDGSLTGTLTFLTQSHRVRRIKDGRSYRYTLA